jgi:hypothetical protein
MDDDRTDLQSSFRLTIVTCNVGPKGNSNGLFGPSRIPGKKESCNDLDLSHFHR